MPARRIDHFNLAVPDLAAAVAFYEPTLASIGITKMLEIRADPARDQPAMTGFDLAQVTPYSWLLNQGTVATNMHLGFTVDTREDAETFYQAALRAGALPYCPGGAFVLPPRLFRRISVIRTGSTWKPALEQQHSP